MSKLASVHNFTVISFKSYQTWVSYAEQEIGLIIINLILMFVLVSLQICNQLNLHSYRSTGRDSSQVHYTQKPQFTQRLLVSKVSIKTI